jgi:uncharacterized protein YyaL (SSP411 family)
VLWADARQPIAATIRWLETPALRFLDHREVQPMNSVTVRWTIALAASFVGLSLASADDAAAPPKDDKKPRANRLAGETSPYLLQHAHNPVDWFPWSEEAFAKAKKEGKLVFLSIGYSSCYWCHVMERESFSNDAVAKILNEHFVCIKVDREERPDIDTIYMTALTQLDQQGGWPLSMFLTEDGKPVVGFTYRHPDDKEVNGETLKGFKSILDIVRREFEKEPKKLKAQADRLAEATSDALAGTARGLALVDLERPLVKDALDALAEQFDPVHGGFGGKRRKFAGPKFPMPSHLLLLLQEAGRAQKDTLAAPALFTLDQMAQGGIYDQIGGGFHRYSTDRTWTVPHFEKMLYDQAQLVEAYALAHRATRKPHYARVVRETLDFVLREMTSPEGGFYSALDAETDAEEGRFYVWTDKELRAAVLDADERALLAKVYGLDDGVNFEGKYHILRLKRPLAEIAESMNLTEDALLAKLVPLRQKLFDERSKRKRPFLDTKILTAWNGEMIAGFALAGQILKEERYTRAASRAANFVLAKLRTKEGRLLRSYSAQPGKPAEARLNGYLDDYAYLVHGLLTLHDATGKRHWLDESIALTDLMVKHHQDVRHGGFFYTSNDHEKLFARAKDQYDGVQPAGNSVATRNFVRLWGKTADAKYRDLAEKTLKTFAGPMKLSPTSLTAMAASLSLYLDAKENPPKAK